MQDTGKSSLIRQKAEFQNRCFKKTRDAKFSEKWTFLTPWYAHVRVRIRWLKMFVFPNILRALVSWNNRFEIFFFPPYYPRNMLHDSGKVVGLQWNILMRTNIKEHRAMNRTMNNQMRFLAFNVKSSPMILFSVKH